MMRKAEKTTWTEKVAHAGLILKQQDFHSGTALASFVSKVGTFCFSAASEACVLVSSVGTPSPGIFQRNLGIVPMAQI